jgi:hypothetical protein
MMDGKIRRRETDGPGLEWVTNLVTDLLEITVTSIKEALIDLLGVMVDPKLAAAEATNRTSNTKAP